MKKILSFCAALALVISANANPLSLRGINVSNQAPATEQVSAKQTITGKPGKQELVRQVATVNENKSVEKVKIATNTAEKVQHAAPQKIARATQADTVKINSNRISVKEYYPETGDWYVAFMNESKDILVRLDYISESFTGTFTTEDFDMDYTYLTDYGSKKYVNFASLEATIVETEEYTEIAAIGKTAEGVVYSILMHHDIITPKATVNLTFTNVTLNAESDEYFQFEGIDGSKSVSLIIAYNNGSIVGEYTTDDFYPVGGWFSGFAYTDTETETYVDYIEAEATITMENRVYDITASMIGNDSIQYNVKMQYALPVPTDTIDIAISNLEAVDLTYFLGAFWLQGNNADYSVSLTIAADEMATGTYDVETTMLVNTTLGDTIGVSDATADVTVDALDNVTAVAKVYGNDNKLYNITMAFVVPEPTDSVTITFDKSAELFHLTNYGEYGMEAMDDQYIAAAYVYSDKLEGTFEGEDFDRYYSGIGIIHGTDTTLVPVMAGKVTLSSTADTVYMYAEMIGEDAILYKVSMFYALPKAKETVDLIVPDADMVNLLSEGLYQMCGFTEDSTYYISIVPESHQVDGDYTVANLNDTYSAIQYFDANGDIVTVKFLNATINATMSADSIITMKGEVLATDTVLYKITLTGKFVEEDTGMEYDSKDGEVERAYTGDEISFTTDYVAEYGELYVRLTAADGTDRAMIGFYINALDPEITIPAGVYPIDDSGDEGTVMASPGVEDGSVYPSFYGQLTEDGYIKTPMFFLVSGTITVENKAGKLFFEVNARNSYDRPIHITYGLDATAVENTIATSDAVRKTLENGQLIILRDNVKFNVLGAKIK